MFEEPQEEEDSTVYINSSFVRQHDQEHRRRGARQDNLSGTEEHQNRYRILLTFLKLFCYSMILNFKIHTMLIVRNIWYRK